MSGWSKLYGSHLRGAARRTDLIEERHVGRVVLAPLFGQVVLVVDGLNRADRFAGAAVHTFVRVDVERPLALVDAVDRAFVDAGPVLDIDTGQRDDVGHEATKISARETSTCSSRATTFTRSRVTGDVIGLAEHPLMRIESEPARPGREPDAAAREQLEDRLGVRGGRLGKPARGRR